MFVITKKNFKMLEKSKRNKVMFLNVKQSKRSMHKKTFILTTMKQNNYY